MNPTNRKDKLDDMVELLHLWQSEACGYRSLVEAVIEGRFTHDQARAVLSKANSLKSPQAGFMPLGGLMSQEERDAFLAVARKAGLTPAEFLWSCVESMMNSADDEDVLRGCREAVVRRFRDKVMPEWAEA